MATTKNVQQLEIALFPNKEVYDKHKSEVKDKICFVSVDDLISRIEALERKTKDL